MTTPPGAKWTKAERRRRIGIGLLHAGAITAALVAVYYFAPLDRLDEVPVALIVLVGLVTLTAVSTYQVHAVVHSSHPGVRAVQALAITAPLFLLLFAITYFVMARGDVDAFNTHELTRTDSLYFTVTVFSTVGFGDINATSQTARLLVTAQMLLDLVILGLGIRVFLNAVEMGRQRAEDEV